MQRLNNGVGRYKMENKMENKMLLALLFVFSVPPGPLRQRQRSSRVHACTRERANNESPGTDYTKAVSYSNYIKGDYDALDLNEVICPSGDVRVGQVSAVVTANPERWT